MKSYDNIVGLPMGFDDLGQGFGGSGFGCLFPGKQQDQTEKQGAAQQEETGGAPGQAIRPVTGWRSSPL